MTYNTLFPNLTFFLSEDIAVYVVGNPSMQYV